MLLKPSKVFEQLLGGSAVHFVSLFGSAKTAEIDVSFVDCDLSNVKTTTIIECDAFKAVPIRFPQFGVSFMRSLRMSGPLHMWINRPLSTALVIGG